jgi:hypothetical protein
VRHGKRLRIGPYVPPYRTRRHTGPAPEPAYGTTALVDEPGRRSGAGPSWDDPLWTDPELRTERRGGAGPRPARRWLAVLAALAALAVVGLAVVGLLGRAPGHRDAATPGGTGSSPSAAPVFAPITLEAEGDTTARTGSAQVVAYPGASGGKVVRYVGDWGRPGGPGALRFTGIVVPATGTYVLTLAFVNANANDTTRSVVVTASGSGSSVAVVAAGTACCATQLVEVRLAKGDNTITLANPHGHAPTIDKITISPRQ